MFTSSGSLQNTCQTLHLTKFLLVLSSLNVFPKRNALEAEVRWGSQQLTDYAVT